MTHIENTQFSESEVKAPHISVTGVVCYHESKDSTQRKIRIINTGNVFYFHIYTQICGSGALWLSKR